MYGNQIMASRNYCSVASFVASSHEGTAEYGMASVNSSCPESDINHVVHKTKQYHQNIEIGNSSF